MTTMAMEVGMSCVILRTTGRGNGSLYQNYGDIDVLEGIDHVTQNYAIGRDRITTTGGNRYPVSHYPLS